MNIDNEIKDITVKDFVDGYNSCPNQETKKSYIRDNLKLKTEYVSYILKIELCRALVEHFCMNDTKEYIHINSPFKHMFFQKTLIQQYTNIVIEDPSFWKEYDMLKSNDLLKDVIAIIPKKEVLEFKDVLDMTQNDYIANYMEIHTFIERQWIRIRSVANTVLSPILNELTDKINNLSKGDSKRIAEYLNSIVKEFKK